MISSRSFTFAMAFVFTLMASGHSSQSLAVPLSIANKPLFLGENAPPLLMLVMGRDHTLYYEAYNDASDLNGDGQLDIRYSPEIDYYGYFNSYACYDYEASDPARFVPRSVKSATAKAAGKKTCAEGEGAWSGDFLNYVTTARIDALRKVFYGGYRKIDTASTTVLERTHIPQDAHAWAKAYNSLAVDGYAISDYTPLAMPPMGKRHLFGSVSFSVEKAPLLRILPNTSFRPWEWASIERPVLDSQCVRGIGGRKTNCQTSAGKEQWEIAEPEIFANLKLSYYRHDTGNVPEDSAEFADLIATYATSRNRIGAETSIRTMQGSLDDDNYFSVVTGQMIIPESGDYTFAVDGNDAVEFTIRDGNSDHRIGWYGRHNACPDNACREFHSGTFFLQAGTYDVQFLHQEADGRDDKFELYRKTFTAESAFQEFEVRTEVCKTGLLEDNCKLYSDGNESASYKPTGLLHDYGEDESVLFGLLTGSHQNNLDGGVLRKVVSSFANEVNSADGTFTDANGIVGTIDKLRTVNFSASEKVYKCRWKLTGPIKNGECDMWGNPVGEMMYEAVRYFAGKGEPTDAFKIDESSNSDSALGLPNAAWDNPFDPVSGQPYCASPNMLVLSDVNISYDSDKVPGSAFSQFTGDLADLDVSALADTMTLHEPDVTGLHYIGQSGDDMDSAPTPKNVTSLATIRGLAPEEPTKLGSYYSAAVAYYGWKHDLFPSKGSPERPTRISTYAIALASPLPRISITLDNGRTITLVPFGKSVGEVGGTISPEAGDFQPTNTIVDFYVESLTETKGSFLINFEDVEQGADHDMDAIARYQYELTDDGNITVKVDSLYAFGSLHQHLGYVISGTTADGVYLVVKDVGGAEVNYYLDMPAGRENPSAPRGDEMLTLKSSRVFTPGSSAIATVLKDPLYYAAKWGGFNDTNGNQIPDQAHEWDAKNNMTHATGADGVPDNYFQVTNALGLKDQLSAVLQDITEREASASTVTVNAGALNTNSLLFQAAFNAGDWSGDVFAYPVTADGIGRPAWSLRAKLADQLSVASGFNTRREIVTYNAAEGRGVAFRWPANPSAPTRTELSTVQVSALKGANSENPDAYGEAVLNYIRGDQSEEGATASFAFRQRETVLGDITHSDPLFVPQPGFFYPDKWKIGGPENGHPYSAFRATFSDREPVLYFGANDGMFHAVSADRNTGGPELLAYVPSPVYGGLGALTSPDYVHQYYVDGPSTYGDVFFKGKWHTALVGTLRAGGQGVFALDITDPEGLRADLGYPSFDEADAADLVLWEFTDADDEDLGYTFGKPVIVRMASGKWAAVFGNGYNNTAGDAFTSSTGNAVLYVVDIESGKIIKKFDTEYGAEDDPEGRSRPNGLASPAVVDVDGDYVADAIYAGDLFGNMWKFDVSGSSPKSWRIAHGTDLNPEPLFVATDAEGDRLPITSRPAVGSHPDPFEGGGDVMVYFGTGKYFEISDNRSTGQNTQAFFGIWDDGYNGAGRGDLLQQEVLAEAAAENYAFRLVTDHLIRWKVAEEDPSRRRHRGWFIDLLNVENGNTDNQGERVIAEPILRNDRVIFTTLIPSQDVCAAGGSGWLMELSAISGARLETSPFDINDDGLFDAGDLIDFGSEGKAPTGGVRQGGLDGGIPTQPVILDDPACKDGVCTENKYTGTSKATIEKIVESSSPAVQGPQNWREVH